MGFAYPVGAVSVLDCCLTAFYTQAVDTSDPSNIDGQILAERVAFGQHPVDIDLDQIPLDSRERDQSPGGEQKSEQERDENNIPLELAFGPLELASGPLELAFGPLELAFGPLELAFGPLEPVFV